MEYKSNFLKKHNVWPPFDRIVTDFSMANLIAINTAFNNLNLLDYLEIAFEAVTNGKDLDEIIKIHLCRSHLTKNMAAL
jgi:hypothetical protein